MLTLMLVTKVRVGDVSLSAEDRPHVQFKAGSSAVSPTLPPLDHENVDDDDGDFPGGDEAEHSHWLGGMTALKFLLAGGLAGAGLLVSYPS
jgi:hypothetical protein